MRILLLGPKKEKIIKFLVFDDNYVINTNKKIDCSYIKKEEIDFIISYGYRHIINENVLEKLNYRAINLHISYLPWNRGADPNLWSFVENTKKGVTIHYIDTGIDSGDIIIQKEVPYLSSDTLKSSYERLILEIEKLFIDNWTEIKDCRINTHRQPIGGSYHKKIDRKKIDHLITKGWDTSIQDLLAK